MNIPLSSLYLPGLKLYQTRAQAAAAGETVPDFDTTLPPKYWRVAPVDGADPDAPFTIHNLHDANGNATWGVSYIPNSQAWNLNMPPDAANATNAPVYPPSIPIPMSFDPTTANHLPSGDSVIDTPFGLQLSDGNPGQAAPAAAGADPTLVRVLNGVNALLGLDKLPPV